MNSGKHYVAIDYVSEKSVYICDPGRDEQLLSAYKCSFMHVYEADEDKVMPVDTGEPEGEMKRAMLRSLAIYMRQQYLIWNKDSVADETIFADIEKLSNGRIRIPADLELSKISDDANFSRPGLNLGIGQNHNKNQKKHRNRK